MKVALSLLAALACISVASAEIGSDMMSTLKIVGKLCLPGGHEDAIATQFYDCYDLVPDQRERFDLCQVESFNNILDTKSHINGACFYPWRLFGYITCLKGQFEGADEELQQAVQIINVCQAKVLNVE